MTTITESFNTADSDILGPDQTWKELTGDMDVASSTAVLSGAVGVTAVAVATSTPLSSIHYAQAFVSSSTTDQAIAGLIVRNDATSSNYYQAIIIWGSAEFRLDKIVNSSQSTLTTIPTGGAALSGTMKASIDGTNPGTLKLYWDGVEKVSITDSDIDSGFYAGITGWRGTTATITLDSFVAGDLNEVHSAPETLWVVQSNQRW